MPKIPNNPQFRGPQSLGRDASGASIGPALQHAGKTLAGISGEMDQRFINLAKEDNKAKLIEDAAEFDMAMVGFWEWTKTHQDSEGWEAKLTSTLDGISSRMVAKGGNPALVKARANLMNAKKSAASLKMESGAGLLRVTQITETHKKAIERAYANKDYGAYSSAVERAVTSGILTETAGEELLFRGEQQEMADRFDSNFVETEDISERIEELEKKNSDGSWALRGMDPSQRKSLTRSLKSEQTYRANVVISKSKEMIGQGRIKNPTELVDYLVMTKALTIPQMEVQRRSYVAELEGKAGPTVAAIQAYEDRIYALETAYEEGVDKTEYMEGTRDLMADVLNNPSHPKIRHLVSQVAALDPKRREEIKAADAVRIASGEKADQRTVEAGYKKLGVEIFKNLADDADRDDYDDASGLLNSKFRADTMKEFTKQVKGRANLEFTDLYNIMSDVFGKADSWGPIDMTDPDPFVRGDGGAGMLPARKGYVPEGNPMGVPGVPLVTPWPGFVSEGDPMGEGAAFGYPVRKPSESELDYFKKNKGVAGMATEDNKIILNPFSNNSPKEQEAVVANEGLRLWMKENDWRPTFSISAEQKKNFAGTEYAKPKNLMALRRTIIARYLTGDPSAGTLTKEQKVEAERLKVHLPRR